MANPLLLNLFPTPLLEWETNKEELREKLLRDVLAKRSGTRALGAEYVVLDCFDFRKPENAAMQEMIRTALSSFIKMVATKEVEMPSYGIKGVARLIGTGDFVTPRDSGQADLSGIFYLDIGDGSSTEIRGSLEFTDPRMGIKKLPGRNLSANALVTPKPGLLLMYPGWFKRVVYPYEGQKPRILLDFDIRFRPKDADNAS